MIISNFYIIRITFMPLETNPPLFIDAYAVLSFSITVQRFQAIRRENSKRIQIGRCI